MNELYQAARLSAEEVKAMPSYLDGTAEFYGTRAFEKLYEYLAFEVHEMPYGVAKARTETRDEWILDYITDMVA